MKGAKRFSLPPNLARFCVAGKKGAVHSGKKAVTRAKMLVGRGAEIIALASCMRKGNPIGFPCPHFQTIKEAVEKKVGASVKIIDWPH